MHLSLAFLMAFALRIRNSSQNFNSDEDNDGKCTIHASDVYQTAMEVDYESEGIKVTQKLLSKSGCNMLIKLVSDELYDGAQLSGDYITTCIVLYNSIMSTGVFLNS